ncbi:MAG: hypothetical protein OEM43_07095 [Gammaproteobacteria bacterium]|nr:hypothetical protein [Gammaproteobacteria bacterium]
MAGDGDAHDRLRYAAAPREVSVIPRERAACSARQVNPGVTRIRVWIRRGSLQVWRFIMMHKARFERALTRKH